MLFPFSALGHPDEPGFNWGTDPDVADGANVGSPTTAHTIQSRLSLTF